MLGRGISASCVLIICLLGLAGCGASGITCNSSVAQQPAALSIAEEVSLGYVKDLCRGPVFHCNSYMLTDLGRRVFDSQRHVDGIRSSSAAAGTCPIPPASAPQASIPPAAVAQPPVNQPVTQKTVCVPSTQANLAPTCSLVMAPICPPLGLQAADASVPVRGYGPGDLQLAYNITCESTKNGFGATVAILTFGDGPGEEKDMATYRSAFGLPPCTSASGCFKKVNFDGSSVLPPQQGSEEVAETELDIQAVSAVCPHCNILLVETPVGTSTQNASLLGIMAQAVQTAASFHPAAFSVSLGWDEDPGHAAAWNVPGLPIAVATGDNGFFDQTPSSQLGNSSPSDYNSVISVGGTSLLKNAGSARGWSESAWSGSGSGCSKLIAKAFFQTPDLCGGGRMQADVSAVADPRTGLAVFMGSLGTGMTGGVQGWHVIGGTSAAAPIIAGIYALGGQAAGGAQSIYSAAGSAALNDIVQGANGRNCAPAALCQAQAGFDGPTGNGTPNGPAAFH